MFFRARSSPPCVVNLSALPTAVLFGTSGNDLVISPQAQRIRPWMAIAMASTSSSSEAARKPPTEERGTTFIRYPPRPVRRRSIFLVQRLSTFDKITLGDEKESFICTVDTSVLPKTVAGADARDMRELRVHHGQQRDECGRAVSSVQRYTDRLWRDQDRAEAEATAGSGDRTNRCASHRIRK